MYNLKEMYNSNNSYIKDNDIINNNLTLSEVYMSTIIEQEEGWNSIIESLDIYTLYESDNDDFYDDDEFFDDDDLVDVDFGSDDDSSKGSKKMDNLTEKLSMIFNKVKKLFQKLYDKIRELLAKASDWIRDHIGKDALFLKKYEDKIKKNINKIDIKSKEFNGKWTIAKYHPSKASSNYVDELKCITPIIIKADQADKFLDLARAKLIDNKEQAVSASDLKSKLNKYYFRKVEGNYFEESDMTPKDVIEYLKTSTKCIRHYKNEEVSAKKDIDYLLKYYKDTLTMSSKLAKAIGIKEDKKEVNKMIKGGVKVYKQAAKDIHIFYSCTIKNLLEQFKDMRIIGKKIATMTINENESKSEAEEAKDESYRLDPYMNLHIL